MNLSAIIEQFSELPALGWLVLLLVALAVIWLVKNLLEKNGKLKVEIVGKEVLEVETESLSQNKNGNSDTLNLTPREEKQVNIILGIDEVPKLDDTIQKTDSRI